MVIKNIGNFTGHLGSLYAIDSLGGNFYSAGGDGQVVEWSFSNPDIGKLIAHVESQVLCIKIIDQNTLVIGDLDGGIHWINLQEKRRVKGIFAHEKGVYRFALHENNLISIGADGTVLVWDIETKSKRYSSKISSTNLRGLSYMEENNSWAIGDGDGKIFILDDIHFETKEIFKAHDKTVFSLAWDKKNKILFSGGRDALIKGWIFSEGKWSNTLNTSLPAHRYTINDLLISNDESFLISASRDRTIKIWKTENLELLKVLEGVRDRGHSHSVNSLANANGFGNNFLSVGDDRKGILWEM
jgi:WD40 repeat protein